MDKKTVKLSVGDFSPPDAPPSGDRSQIWNLIATEGKRFPESFTFNRPNMLDGVAFCLCMSGNARIRINSRVYDVDPRTAVTILPMHIVEPLERSDDLVLRLLVFTLDMVSEARLDIEAVRNAGLTPCICVSEEEKRMLLSMHEVIIRLYRRGDYARNRPVIKSMLNTLLLELESIYLARRADSPVRRRSRPEELAEAFFKLLVQHYRQQHTPAFYADRLCVTTKYLSQAVRESSGDTVFTWINKIIVAGAQSLLRTTDLTVLQVSEELHFPNPSFFGRYFKKHTGQTPFEYRKGRSC